MWPLQIQPQVRRKVFVSYHHGGDQAYYNHFSQAFHDTYELITDNSLERAIGSEDDEYVMRRIRENYITGSSCTVVLVGNETHQRKYVDWEIKATLEKYHGLIGVQLPTVYVNPYTNTVSVPERLSDNINSGYALWLSWSTLMQNAEALRHHIELANSRPPNRIVNTRLRRMKNG